MSEAQPTQANQPPQEDIEARLARTSAAWSSGDASPAVASPAAPARRNFLVEFLAENWLWILVPALLVIGLLGATALYLKSTNAGDSTTPFVYAMHD